MCEAAGAEAQPLQDYREEVETHFLACTAFVFLVSAGHGLSQVVTGWFAESPWLLGYAAWVAASFILFGCHCKKSRGPHGEWLKAQQEKPWLVILVDLFMTGAFVFLAGGCRSGMMFLFCWCFLFDTVLLLPVHGDKPRTVLAMVLYGSLALLVLVAATVPYEVWSLHPMNVGMTPAEARLKLGDNAWLVWLQYALVLLLIVGLCYACLGLRRIARRHLAVAGLGGGAARK